ncbi:unnamed protein product, partial [Prorocentrum cordatum]
MDLNMLLPTRGNALAGTLGMIAPPPLLDTLSYLLLALLSAMLQSCIRQATDAIAATSMAQVTSCQTQLVRMFQTQQEAVNRSLAVQTRDIASIGQRADALEAEQAAMRKQIGDINKALALAEKELPITDFQELEAWSRQPNPRIFSVGAPQLVGPAQALQGLEEWIRAAGLTNDMVRIDPAVPAKRSNVLVQGGDGVALPRAQALARHLRDPAGRNGWRSFSAQSVGGGVVPLYLSPDKSPQQVRMEIQSRKLSVLLAEALPDQSFSAQRARGIVTSQGVKVAKLEMGESRNTDTIIRWNPDMVARLHIDRESINTQFKKAFSTEDNTECTRSSTSALPAYRFDIVAAGRAALLTITDCTGKCSMQIFNIHNYDLKPHEFTAVQRTWSSGLALARRDSLPRIFLGVGDFNIANRPPVSQRAPTDTTAWRLRPDHRCQLRQPAWRRLFAAALEVESQWPTHYDKSSKQLSTIDRIFLGIDAHAMLSVSTILTTARDAMELSEEGISDHAPLVLQITAARQVPRDEQPIPTHLFNHRKYPETYTLMLDHCSLAGETAEGRWRAAKQCMKLAARRVRDDQLRTNFSLRVKDSMVETSYMGFKSAARAVWRQDAALAGRLLESCPALAAHLHVTDGTVRLVDPHSFATNFDAVAERVHSLRRQAAEAAARTANVRDSAAWRRVERKAARHAQLWVPWRRRMILSGLRVDSAPCAAKDSKVAQHVVSDPAGMKATVANYWGEIFAKVPNSEQLKALGAFLDKHAPRKPAAELPQPALHDLERAASRAPPSAAGPDQLSCAAWRRSPGALQHLQGLMEVLFNDGVAPLDLNWSIFICVPKGTEEDDVPDSCARTASTVRTLSLKSCDAKLIAACADRGLQPIATSSTSPEQKGFTAGRRFVDHIPHLDAECRREGLLPDAATRRPMFLSFDFRQAFPSLFREVIEKVLPRFGVPLGFCNVVAALYSNCLAFSSFRAEGTSAEFEPLFAPLCGIMQGCPLSGTVWCLAMDAPIRALLVAIAEHGFLTACADDLGMLIKNAVALPSIDYTFVSIECAFNLQLALHKCVLVPLWEELSEDTLQDVKSFLAEEVPRWSGFRVDSTAKYLGLLLGFCNVVAALYSNCLAFSSFRAEGASAEFEPLFALLCGIMQGCPLSGTVWCLAMDAPIRALLVAIAEHGFLTACADDLGMLIKNAVALPSIDYTFVSIEFAFNLQLALHKCVLVPLWEELSEDTLQDVKSFLAEEVPRWSGFRVDSTAKYLGTHLGPGVTDFGIWKAAAGKWWTRCWELARTGMATSLAARACNINALPCLSYLAQFYFIVPAIWKVEFTSLHRLLRLPPSSMRKADILSMSAWCGPPSPTGLFPYTLAAMMRTAENTVREWEAHFHHLHEAAVEHVPLVDVIKGNWSPPRWQTRRAIVQNFAIITDTYGQLNIPRPTLDVLPIPIPSRYIKIAKAAMTLETKAAAAAIPNRKPKRQATAAISLRGSLYPEDLVATIHRRLRRWGVVCSLPELRERWPPLRDKLTEVRPAWMWSWIRTAVNGWTTSRRMSAVIDARPCLFGCDEEDALEHYIVCPILRAMTAGDAGADSLGHGVELLGFGDAQFHARRPITDCIYSVGLMCQCYHIQKHRVDVGLDAGA